MRIDVVVNRTARKYRRDPELLGRASRALAGRATLWPTSSLEELEKAAREIARRGSSAVILAGGDGTATAGVSALCRAFGEGNLPRLGLAPGGTVATVARNWGVRGEPLSALERVVEAAERGRAQKRGSLRVVARGASAAPTERVGFIFGAGLVARFFELYEAEGAGGERVAARIALRVFLGSFFGGKTAARVLEPAPSTLEVEGRPSPALAHSLVCAAAVPDLGLGLRVTYRAGEDLGRPHLVASSLPPRELGKRAHRVLAGQSIGGEGHVDELVSRFSLRFPAEESFVLDGERFSTREVEVSAGPTLLVCG